MLLSRIYELQRQGLSARRIALALGDGLTRNAVIGLLYRARKKREAGEIARPPMAVPRKPVLKDPLKLFAPAVIPPRAPVPPARTGVPLMETHARGCRWIVGRDARGPLYCNERRADGRFYQWCPHHYERGTRKVSDGAN